MQTTKLYVEYIIIGMETLVWIILLVLLVLGEATLKFWDYCVQNLLTSVFMIGLCYILGLLTDRVADKLTDEKKKRIKMAFPLEASTSILVWEKIKQDTFAAFTLSRIRILRSTMLNSFLIGIVGMLVASFVYYDMKIGLLSIAFFEGVSIIACQAHKDLLVNYYKKTQNLEYEMKGKEKG